MGRHGGRPYPELQWASSWKMFSCRTQKRRAFPGLLELVLALGAVDELPLLWPVPFSGSTSRLSKVQRSAHAAKDVTG